MILKGLMTLFASKHRPKNFYYVANVGLVCAHDLKGMS